MQSLEIIVHVNVASLHCQSDVPPHAAGGTTTGVTHAIHCSAFTEVSGRTALVHSRRQYLFGAEYLKVGIASCPKQVVRPINRKLHVRRRKRVPPYI